MKTYDAKDIRNVLLVGHGGAGKTTLLEAMLYTSGAITRMGTVEDGNTVSDHDPDEQRKGISVSLSMAPIEWDGVKINVLDAPGYADFVGDLRSAIRAADAVIVVVSAVDGVEVQTEAAWELAVEAGLPRAIFVNKLDRERSSFQDTLDQLVSSFGNQVAPLELPIGAEAEFSGIADLLHAKADRYPNGPIAEEGDWPDELHAVADPLAREADGGRGRGRRRTDRTVPGGGHALRGGDRRRREGRFRERPHRTGDLWIRGQGDRSRPAVGVHRGGVPVPARSRIGQGDREGRRREGAGERRRRSPGGLRLQDRLRPLRRTHHDVPCVLGQAQAGLLRLQLDAEHRGTDRSAVLVAGQGA